MAEQIDAVREQLTFFSFYITLVSLSNDNSYHKWTIRSSDLHEKWWCRENKQGQSTTWKSRVGRPSLVETSPARFWANFANVSITKDLNETWTSFVSILFDNFDLPVSTSYTSIEIFLASSSKLMHPSTWESDTNQVSPLFTTFYIQRRSAACSHF